MKKKKRDGGKAEIHTLYNNTVSEEGERRERMPFGKKPRLKGRSNSKTEDNKSDIRRVW